jgi:hypothetical protein
MCHCVLCRVRVSQVVGVRLAKHVLRNQDKLIAGITNVTLVEDDLKVRVLAYACIPATHSF